MTTATATATATAATTAIHFAWISQPTLPAMLVTGLECKATHLPRHGSRRPGRPIGNWLRVPQQQWHHSKTNYLNHLGDCSVLMVPVWNGCSPSKMRFWAFTHYNIQFFCVDTILTLFCCGHYGHLGSSVLFLVVIFASAFVVYWVIPCHLFSVLWRFVSCWFVLLFVIFFWFSLSCSFVKFLKGLCQGLCPTIVSPQLCSHCLSCVYSFLFFVRSLFWFVSVSHVPLKLVCSDQKNRGKHEWQKTTKRNCKILPKTWNSLPPSLCVGASFTGLLSTVKLMALEWSVVPCLLIFQIPCMKEIFKSWVRVKIIPTIQMVLYSNQPMFCAHWAPNELAGLSNSHCYAWLLSSQPASILGCWFISRFLHVTLRFVWWNTILINKCYIISPLWLPENVVCIRPTSKIWANSSLQGRCQVFKAQNWIQ